MYEEDEHVPCAMFETRSTIYEQAYPSFIDNRRRQPILSIVTYLWSDYIPTTYNRKYVCLNIPLKTAMIICPFHCILMYIYETKTTSVFHSIENAKHYFQTIVKQLSKCSVYIFVDNRHFSSSFLLNNFNNELIRNVDDFNWERPLFGRSYDNLFLKKYKCEHIYRYVFWVVKEKYGGKYSELFKRIVIFI